MPRLRQGVAFAVVSLSLLVSSTVAAAPAPQQPTPIDPWLALSMLNSSGAAVLGSAPGAALCGAVGAAAAQPSGGCVLPQVGVVPATQPPGPPPPPEVAGGFPTPPIPVALIWVAVIGLGIYLALKDHDHGNQGNSPT
jgi:hypothetical protein